jgi:hypothetical protein
VVGGRAGLPTCAGSQRMLGGGAIPARIGLSCVVRGEGDPRGSWPQACGPWQSGSPGDSYLRCAIGDKANLPGTVGLRCALSGGAKTSPHISLLSSSLLRALLSILLRPHQGRRWRVGEEASGWGCGGGR